MKGRELSSGSYIKYFNKDEPEPGIDFFITGYWGPKEYKMSKNAFKDLGPQLQ
jgi:hypothetical protein